MPGWHKAIQNLPPEQLEKVQVVGIIQEQHADRCQLFAQWHQFDWPILHDPTNSLGLRAVPVTVAIDEYGIVRHTKPNAKTIVTEFLEEKYVKPQTPPKFSEPVKPEMEYPGDGSSIELIDREILWGDDPVNSMVLTLCEKELEERATSGDTETTSPQNAPLLFRMGVAYRMHSESTERRDDDFAVAIRYWSEALELDSNNYIYRRRIQQYGPRLDKPYPFYDWVDQAIIDIKARGDEPVKLKTMPTGAEIAKPQKEFKSGKHEDQSPDPDGRIDRDGKKLVVVTPVTVPIRIKPGASARIHLDFRLAEDDRGKNRSPKAKWNNEGEPMQVWIDSPNGGQVERNLWEVEVPSVPESTEQRTIEFEIKAPEKIDKPLRVRGYSLFNICEADGQCLYLRKDFEVEIPVEYK